MLDPHRQRRRSAGLPTRRRPLQTFLLYGILGALVGCSPPASEAPQLVLTGGMIYPLGPSETAVSAIAIRDDEILAVGTDQEILALADDYTQQMRLEEAAVLPGSVDAWIDLEALGRWSDSPLDLRLASSMEEVQAMVRNAAGADPNDTSWLVGWGWSESDWPQPVLPTAAALDGTGGTRPIVLLRRSGHVAWANVVALQMLAAALPAAGDPPGGRVLRHSDGSAAGILAGTAVDLLLANAPPHAAEQRRAWLAAGARAASAAGITRVGTTPIDAAALGYLLELDTQGLLPVRVDARLRPDAVDAIEETDLATRLHRSALVHVVAVGVRVDGPLTARLAAVASAYPGDTEQGVLYADARRLAVAAERARSAGLALHLHAEGDRAIETAVAALGSEPAAGDLLAGADLPAAGFDAAGVAVAITPARFARDVYWLGRVLGADRAGGAHPWSELASAGVRLYLASDGPANDIGPLRALATATTRQDAAGYPAGGWHVEMALPLRAGLRALVGADPAGDPLLRPGAAADLVVWSENPVDGGTQALLRGQALLTIVAGRVAYSRALVDLPMSTERSR